MFNTALVYGEVVKIIKRSSADLKDQSTSGYIGDQI